MVTAEKVCEVSSTLSQQQRGPVNDIVSECDNKHKLAKNLEITAHPSLMSP